MLKLHEALSLRWNPIRHANRMEGNYAISSYGRTPKGIQYLMACSHKSMPGQTVCERGCRKRIPAWHDPNADVRDRLTSSLNKYASHHNSPKEIPMLQDLAARFGKQYYPRQVA